MKRLDRRLAGLGSFVRRHGILFALALVAATAVAAVAAGCGSSGGTPATSRGGATSIQVLTTVQRGDLVESAMGSVKLVASKGKTVVVAQVPQQSASSVAKGQTATVMFFRPRANGQGGSPFGQSGQSGAPFPQGGQGGQSGAPFPQGGQGGFGQGGFDQRRFGGRGTPGTVTAVTPNADGSAAVTIAIKKLPANVTAKSVGFASIQTKVLASNVIIVPTAAIKVSGSSATVQVLSGGKTSARAVVVGQQAGTESEIVSGLSVGENIVWTRSFQRGGFFRGGSPFPGQGQQGMGGGQSGGSASGGGFQ
jgi:hypothetical protein